MPERIRKLIEALVFAGMQPAGAKSRRPPRNGWLARLGGAVENFLSPGPAPTDPLYLSNRTFAQRIMPAVKLVIPLLLVAGALVWWYRGTHHSTDGQSTRAELLAKVMPEIAKLNLPPNRDVDIPSVSVDRSGPALVGTVRNNTTHTMKNVEILCDLTDSRGSQLGFVTAQVENLAPQSQTGFRVPIAQTKASLVLVRDIKAE